LLKSLELAKNSAALYFLFSEGGFFGSLGYFLFFSASSRLFIFFFYFLF